MPVAPSLTGAPVTADEADQLFAGLRSYEHIGVAVSGGADSTALMMLLAHWRETLVDAPKITILTVNHGLRPAATSETQQVCQWATNYHLPCVVLQNQTSAPQSGVQNWARNQRYRLLNAWCQENAVKALISAHHMEDQAETILMRLARSSGTDGLAGMAHIRALNHVTLLRPILALSKNRLLASLKAGGQAWIDDPSNNDRRFERTRWRQAQPVLDELGLTAPAIMRAGQRQARASAALDVLTAQALCQMVTLYDTGHGVLDRALFEGQPEEIRLRMLQQLVKMLGGGKIPALQALEDLGAWCMRDQKGAHGGGRTLAGCKIAKRRDTLIIGREPGRIASGSYAVTTDKQQIWDQRFEVKIRHPADPAWRLTPLGAYEGQSSPPRPDGLPAFVMAGLPALIKDQRLLAVPSLNYYCEPTLMAENGLIIRFCATIDAVPLQSYVEN